MGLDSDRHHETELDSIAEKGVGLLRDIRNVIDDEATKRYTSQLRSTLIPCLQLNELLLGSV